MKNLLTKKDRKKEADIKTVELELPIREWKHTKAYGLIITDNSGVTHYFDWDGTYDGWSRNVEYSEN